MELTQYAGMTELERLHNEDYDWALYDPEIQRTYAGRVVAVSRKRILADGKDMLEALRAAQQLADCPARVEIALVYLEGIAPVRVRR